MLLLGAASLFGFVAQQTNRDATEAAVYSQAIALSDEIAKFVSKARSVDLPQTGSIVALRCQMPGNGVDTDQDGLADSFSIASYDYNNDKEAFTTGNYVWFYMSNSTGAWGVTGTNLWRASPATSANPVAGDLNTNWAYYYGGSSSRWNFIDSVTYVLDAAHEKLTFTIKASSYNRAERSAASETQTSDNSKVTVTRTVFWRGYR